MFAKCLLCLFLAFVSCCLAYGVLPRSDKRKEDLATGNTFDYFFHQPLRHVVNDKPLVNNDDYAIRIINLEHPDDDQYDWLQGEMFRDSGLTIGNTRKRRGSMAPSKFMFRMRRYLCPPLTCSNSEMRPS